MNLKHRMKTVFSIFFTMALLFMGNATAQVTFESLGKNFFNFKSISADFTESEQHFDLDGNPRYEEQSEGCVFINFQNRTYSAKYSMVTTSNGKHSKRVVETLYGDRTLKELVEEGENTTGSICKTRRLPIFTELWNISAAQEPFIEKLDPKKLKVEEVTMESGEQAYKVSFDFFNLYFSKRLLLLKSEAFFLDEKTGKRKLARESYAYNYDTHLPYPFPERIVVKNYYYPSGNRAHISEVKFDLGSIKFDENKPLLDVVFPLGCTVFEGNNIYKVTDAAGSNTPEENMVNMLEKLIEDSKN